MKRKIVNTLFNTTRSKKKIFFYSFMIILLSSIFVLSILSYIDKSKKEYIKYKEYSDIDYKVYLKENSFFKNSYAEEEKQYIASLIDYINATFKYSMNIEKESVDLEYSYSIDAKVDVKDKRTTKSLYSFTETLLSNEIDKSYGSKNYSVVKTVNIDYNKYNNLIKSFISSYGLNDIESTLTVSMHINTTGTCKDLVTDHNKDSVISLVIPLTTKTIAIDISDDLIKTSDNLLICKAASNPYEYIFISVIMLISDIFAIVSLYNYIVKTRTSRDIYEIELKKILSNYHAYIQKVNNDFDVKGYQMLAVDTFTDMLEIRDTLQQPILMVENEQKNGVHFIIPSNTKLLYVYTLKEKTK